LYVITAYYITIIKNMINNDSRVCSKLDTTVFFYSISQYGSFRQCTDSYYMIYTACCNRKQYAICSNKEQSCKEHCIVGLCILCIWQI